MWGRLLRRLWKWMEEERGLRRGWGGRESLSRGQTGWGVVPGGGCEGAGGQGEKGWGPWAEETDLQSQPQGLPIPPAALGRAWDPATLQQGGEKWSGGGYWQWGAHCGESWGCVAFPGAPTPSLLEILRRADRPGEAHLRDSCKGSLEHGGSTCLPCPVVVTP